MGATAISLSVNSSTWANEKPADYTDTALDKTIKAVEAMKTKAPTVPASLPAVPTSSAKEIKACIKTLESAITDFKKGVTYLEQLGEALKAVSVAASKTAGDLKKQAKDKSDKEKSKYLSAASIAAGIGDQAAADQKKIA